MKCPFCTEPCKNKWCSWSNYLPKLMVLVVLVSTVGCSTPYQKKGFRGGYEDFQVAKDTYIVTVDGNGYTGMGALYGIGLRRSKELCPNGFDILDGNTNSDTNLSSNINGTGYQTVTRHSIIMNIKCNHKGNQ